MICAPKMTHKMKPKSLKIHSRSHPETNPQKITKIYRTKTLQTLEIELSCKRGASFHIFTISKKNKEVVQQHLKSNPKTTQNAYKNLPNKHLTKTPQKHHRLPPTMTPKWRQNGPLERTLSTRSAPWTPRGTKRVQRRPKDTKITEKVTSKTQESTKKHIKSKSIHINT